VPKKPENKCEGISPNYNNPQYRLCFRGAKRFLSGSLGSISFRRRQDGKLRFGLPIRRRFANFAARNPYQDLVDDQNLPLRDTRRFNRKIEAITGGMIVGMTVYAWDDSCSKQAGANIVKISEANYRDNPDLCMRIIVEALVSLPPGFYTVVYHTDPLPYVMDFRVDGKGCKLRVRSFDRETINRIKLPAALRVVVV
jgi:hypothetical protein